MKIFHSFLKLITFQLTVASFYVAKTKKHILKTRWKTTLLSILLIIPLSLNADIGDSCESAESIDVPSITSVTLAYRWGTGWGTNGRYYVYQFTAPSKGTVHIYTTDADTDTDSELYNADCSTILTNDYEYTNNISMSYNVTEGTVYKIYLYNFNRFNYGNFTLYIDFVPDVTTPPVMGDIPDQNATIGVDYSLSLSTYVTPTDGDPILSYTLTGTLPAGLDFNSTTGLISGIPSAGGTFHLSASATDKDGTSNIDDFDLTVVVPPPTPPIMDPVPDQTPRLNVFYILDISDYVTLTEGDPIEEYLLTGTLPAGLSFNTTTGRISGTPTAIETATVSVSAKDDDGWSNIREFDITITNETDFYNGIVDFTLINPANTQNIVGNYAILGNTVECITEKSGTSYELNSYEGTCQNSHDYNDNNYMAKYIDIDGNSGIGTVTWNSTSSNFTLPDNYSQEDGLGIVWAGLFWQGAINNDLSYKQRRAYLQNDVIQYKYITEDEDIDLENTEGNKVLIRIDNDTNYTPLQAATFYYDKVFGDSGGYYAAYTDITALLQDKNLAAGKHTITIANITANEGRQSSTGDYAGWSVVVIYKESGDDAKPRNISIYNGYTKVYNGFAPPPVEISGFKLPNSGEVNAQFAAFAGEGEYIYGTPSGKYDRMIMSKNSDLSYPKTMPDATDPDNIFDAILANIDRDSGNNNEMTGNNNGIDIENYNVSSIMTAYRDTDRDINTVYIGLSSTHDYITPSMMAFSAELYKPNLCYDYVAKRDNYTISSQGLDINSTFIAGETLRMNIAIRSLESDFDLNTSAIAILMHERQGHVLFDPTSAFYSPTNSNVLLPTIVTDNSTSYRPEIAIGKNRDPHTGGVIGPFERYYSQFNYTVTDTNASRFEASFTIELNTTVDYGSGPVSQILPIQQCEQSLIYNPVWLNFNVERHTEENPVINNDTDRYSLYTQIAGRDFDYSVVSYEKDSLTDKYTKELPVNNMTVDVELIDASAFDDNTSFLKCANPNPDIIFGGFGHSTFVHFENKSRVPVTLADDFSNTYAIKNTAFRMWIMTDENDTVIPHMFERTDGAGFRQIYEEYFQKFDTNGYCSIACNTVNGTNENSTCYNCLRSYFAKPICSRDNFAIRPESYRINVYDAGPEGEYSSTKLHLIKNDQTSVPSNNAALAAEYKYLMQAYATKDLNDAVAIGYYNDNFHASTLTTVPSDNISDIALIEFADNTVGCNDTNHTSLGLIFSNGSIQDFNLSHNNVGDYHLWIQDNTWTKVDQASNNPYKTLFDTDCENSDSAACNDCIIGDGGSDISADKYGCRINSDLPAGDEYVDINISFKPYQFDLSSIAFYTRPNTSNSYLYMNDLNKSDVMAVKLEGNITAEGKEGTVLSNFTDTCAAEDVVLWIDRTMIPQENIILGEDGSSIYFQQGIKDITDTFTVQNNRTSTDINSSLTKANFSNTLDINGSAEVDLYFNFEKPYAELVNPIDVNFSMLHAASPNATSNADMLSDYVPDGNLTIDQQRYFYFAEVSPTGDIDGSQVYDLSISTALKVDTFCRDDANITCSLLSGLSASPEESLSGGGGWYRMENHLSSSGDGQVDSLATSVTTVSISGSNPLNNITFDSNGSTSSITLSHPLAGRPVHPVFVITPDEWLKYNPDVSKNGLPEFIIHFLTQGLKWKGEGQTGHVIETEPSVGSSERINW